MKRGNLQLALSISIVMLLMSCAPIVKVTTFEPLGVVARKTNIDVFTSVANIPKPYKEIALITVDDQAWDKDENELTRLLIEKAKDIGADGIIVRLGGLMELSFQSR